MAGKLEPDSRNADDLELGLFGPETDGENGGQHARASGQTSDRNVPSADSKVVDKESFDIRMEARDPVILRSPVRPSAEEVDKHNAVHMPYRSWCPICFRGKGKKTRTFAGMAKIPRSEQLDFRKSRWIIKS